MRDPLGRSLSDRDVDKASETRHLAESDRARDHEKVGPYALAIAIVFAIVVVIIIATR